MFLQYNYTFSFSVLLSLEIFISTFISPSPMYCIFSCLYENHFFLYVLNILNFRERKLQKLMLLEVHPVIYQFISVRDDFSLCRLFSISIELITIKSPLLLHSSRKTNCDFWVLQSSVSYRTLKNMHKV